MPAPDSEFLLLRWSSRALLKGRYTGEMPSLEAIDWHRLLWLGRRHGALLLLHESLRENPGRYARCPAEIHAQLSQLAAAAQLQALARAAEISRLHDLFAQHGIRVAVTDDWMFQQFFGAGRALTETVSEIRCVVSAACETRARELLASAGYPDGRAQFQVVTNEPTPVLLETGFEFSELPAEAIALKLASRQVLAPPPRQWLELFAARHRAAPLTLFQAWQVAVLIRSMGRQRDQLSAPPAGGRSEAVLRRVALASHDLLELPPPFAAMADLPSRPRRSVHVNALEREPPLSPFLPTPPLVGERMLALAGVGPRDVVCDLGCGDGRLVIAAARMFGARGFGIECDPVLVAAAAAQAKLEGVDKRVSFIHGDLFAADIHAATVICFYLLPALCEPVRQLLLPRARAGTRIVSHDYSFSNWPPEKTELIRTTPTRVAQIYLWRIGDSSTA